MPTFTDPCLTHWVPGLRGMNSLLVCVGLPNSFAEKSLTLALCPGLAFPALGFVDTLPVLVVVGGAAEAVVVFELESAPPQPAAIAARANAIETAATTGRSVFGQALMSRRVCDGKMICR